MRMRAFTETIQVNFTQIYNFCSSSFFISYWYWNFSNNRYLFDNWSWNGKRSGNRNPMDMRYLYMVYVILVNIILNNRLCYNLIGRDINIFSSYVCVVLGWLDNIIQLYMLIRLSIKLYIYVFSLNYWLYKCIIIYFLSRSCNCLSSSFFLQNWFSCNWSIILIYRFCFLKFY